ncbi:MAG TPA: methyltransferase domain-containing protein [Myxococcota bacterium]|nr:methyltransferase domain-containing protein [Myxococcota bacterium]
MRRPRFIAEQARNARGPLGRLLAWVMARETWRENLAAMDALDVQPGDHVLDLGSGHGRSLSELARRAPRGRVVGADPSPLMCELATARNRERVRAGQIEVALASAERLPFADASFDKVLCVHVVYFWRDLGASLREIARVTKPGGRLAIASRTAENRAAVAAFPAEVYRFPAWVELRKTLAEAGFEPERADGRDETRETVLLLAKRASQAQLAKD